MIVGAAVCPHPPLLFRELAGLVDAAAGLRAACAGAVAALCETRPGLVVVVGGADRSGSWPDLRDVDTSSFGTTSAPHEAAPSPEQPHPEPPLSLRVGRRLLDEAGWTGPVELRTVAWAASSEELTALGRELAERPERLGLVVLADGSARRGEKAPGYVDARAFPFDEALARAIGTGDVTALRRLDLRLAKELMVLGAPAFRVLGEAFAAAGVTPRAELRHADDPFGVMYLVATWAASVP